MLKRALCLTLALCFLITVPAFAATGYSGNMSASEACIKFIKSFEGFSATVHGDTNGYAIGYGTQCGEFDYPNGITEEEADTLMRADLASMESTLNYYLGNMGITLEQYEYDALVSFTYNLGVGWLNSDYQIYNMLSYGHGGYSDYAVVNIFARYCHVGTEINEGLLARRLAEAKMFLYADYRFGGTPEYIYEYTETEDGDYRLMKETGLTTVSTFWDVTYDMWYYKYISPLTYAEIIDGRGDGSYAPQDYITVGEALKLIMLAAGYPEQAETNLHWASGYLSYAEESGILDYGEIADLDAPITRGLIAKIAVRTLGLSTDVGLSPFADTSDEYVTALYYAGIVEGNTDSGARLYLPDSYMTRAEICAVIWRIYNL